MNTATKIIFAREDLSIPGAEEGAVWQPSQRNAVQDHFLKLVENSEPDVIVLDLSGAPQTGIETILAIRRHTSIPILVVAESADPLIEEYLIAGAVDCVAAPVDILLLNQSVQEILRVTRRGLLVPGETSERLSLQPTRTILAQPRDRQWN